MSPTVKHSKRTRSPSLTEHPARRGPTLSHEPCQALCGCPASREVRRLEARVAELEAELHRKTALLTDDFHDDPEVRRLRRHIEPDNDDTYAAVTLRAAWRECISDAIVKTIREVQHSYSVDPAITASWCVPHAVVPRVVSSRVVMPFLKPDVVLLGARGLTATVCVNGPASVQIDLVENFVAEAQTHGASLDRLPIGGVLEDLCAARLPTSELTRLLNILEGFPSAPHLHALGLICAWCLFRLGEMSLDAFISLSPSHYAFPRRLLQSDVAIEEFFLPAASLCSLDQIDHFSNFLRCADPRKIATAEFRDVFFTRLASVQRINAQRMVTLSNLLEHIVTEANARDAAAFFEPQFVLDWAVRGLAFCGFSGADDPLAHCLCRFFSAAAAAWPTPLVQRALDTFFLPAVDCIHFDDAFPLARCLGSFTYGDPAVSGAALCCTTEFRDRFFVALYRQDPGGRNVSAYEMAEPIADALTHITAAVPRAQRQAVFATAEFRDEVLVRLVERATDEEMDDDVTVAARAAFLNIAENEDGSLHEVFMGDACRASILEPLQSERSASITSAQLFENIREAQVNDIERLDMESTFS